MARSLLGVLPRAGWAVMLLSLLLQSLFPKGVCAITSALQKGMGASSNQGYAARVGVGCGMWGAGEGALGIWGTRGAFH